MNTAVSPHIESSPEIAGGHPRISGRRIKVADIVIWHERLGRTADEIAADHDLSLAEIYAALAYYFDHREALDRAIADDEAFVTALRADLPTRRSPSL